MIALPRKRGVTRRDRALPNRRALLNESVSENVQSRRRSAARRERRRPALGLSRDDPRLPPQASRALTPTGGVIVPETRKRFALGGAGGGG